MTRLTPETVAIIRRRYADGEGCTSIARDLGSCAAHVWAVATGRAWRSVAMPDLSRRVLHVAYARGESHPSKRDPSYLVRGSDHPNAKIHEGQAAAIRRRHRAGESVTELAREYRLSTRGIDKIVAKITWKHVLDDAQLDTTTTTHGTT